MPTTAARPDARRGPRPAPSRHLTSSRAALGALAALLAVLGLALGGASPASATTADDDASASASGTGPPIVLVGTGGIRWDDVSTLGTPALWDLSRTGALGLVAARSVTSSACPADGWLAVSAGARLADLRAEDRTCRTLRQPAPDGGPVPGWDDYVAAADQQSFNARPGLLGDVLAEHEVPVVGIGPGAAIALATADGVPVGTQLARPSDPRQLTGFVREALETSRLVVVDAGSVRDPGYATRSRTGDAELPEAPEEPAGSPGEQEGETEPTGTEAIIEPGRLEQVQAVDARVEAVLRGARVSGATVVVASLSDSGRPRLQLFAATGDAPAGGTYGENLVTSGSTQQRGLVQATDLTPTLLAALGLQDAAPALVGAPVVPVPGPETAPERVDALLSVAAEARHVTRVSGAYTTRLVLGQALLFVAAGVLISRRSRAGVAPVRVLRGAAVVMGAAPVASFLTGVVPWWRADDPVDGFWLTLVGWIAVISAVALLGPWRHHLLGPAGVVAGVTVAVLAGDAFAGSPLVVDSPMGAHRILAARFYGMSNQAFALLTAAGLLLAVVVAHALLQRGRRRLATVAVVVLGLAVAFVDGAPGLGSDFGGPPAIILGFAVLAMVVSGRRVNWRVLLLIAVVGGLAAVGFAVLDWMRPPADRTHLGRFFATVLDGGLNDVVYRKVVVNLRVLGSWRYLVLALVGVGATVAVLLSGRQGKGRWSGARWFPADNPLALLQRDVPLLRPAVAAIAVALTVGVLINDSGIVVLATGVAVAVPCLVAVAAQWLLANPPREDPTPTRPDVVPAPAAAP